MTAQNSKKSTSQSMTSNPINKVKQLRYKQIWELQNGEVDKSQFACQLCCDKEIVVSKARDKFTAKDCKCRQEKEIKAKKEQEQKKYEQNIKSAEIREEFKAKTFKDFKWLEGKKEAKLAAMDYVENFDFYKERGIGLTLVGKCGRGKTLLSHIIGQEIIKKGYTVINAVAKEFYEDIKATYNNFSKNTGDLVSSAKQVDLLIIDNLNAERFGADEIDKLFIIINYRIENKKPTIINSTGDLDYLNKKLASDHVSRLIGKNGEPIKVGGIDMRVKQGELITSLRNKNITRLKSRLGNGY
ncbi:DNA replication protein DnaC [Orenia metallireducens]|uniref:DNA replication protein DnaC n=1 Tax=Orenia metallireducens TaxID=1413210 RepID=A0A285IJ49_9FIRM|nr:DNA replication protein DnaC [Orenia metallireducens]SNY47106.1 DNA replication protein DnaC [Orenia metallireducens]